MNTLFSIREIARIFGLSQSRLHYWAQTGFINPSGRKEGRRAYTFGDLIEVKAAKELLDAGIPLQRVRRNLGALREAMPDAPNPLSLLRVRSDGEEILVHDGPTTSEVVSGQLLLDFDVGDLGRTVAEVLELRRPKTAGDSISTSEMPSPPPAKSAEDSDAGGTSAYGWFLKGCALDDDEGQEQHALAAYEKAAELDPGLAAAHTNMGNLHYRLNNRTAALRSYESAVALDPDQPEALYNIANIYEEEGDLDTAISEYRRALRALPDFGDAHFNLALTLEEVGGYQQASAHWQRFLDLTPETTETHSWRQRASHHLKRAEGGSATV